MPGRFFRIWNCASLAIIALALSVGAASAQDRPAAEVFVEFEGGLVGTEMANVIRALSSESQILPTRLHLPAETVGLCTVLKDQLKVDAEFCTADLLAAIQSINKGQGVELNPNAVNPKTGVILPAVSVTETNVERLYNMSRPAEASRLNDLLSSQAWNHVIQNKVDDVLAGVDSKQQGSPQISEVTIKRIAWQFDIIEPQAVPEATFVARELSNRNVSAFVERSGGFEKARHSSAAQHMEKWCVQPPTPVEAEGGYEEMTGHLYDTADVVHCESDGGSPEVAIMDQPIFNHPDFGGALHASLAAPAQPPVLEKICLKEKFDRNIHHGMLLASIVAANKNKYGFRGMAPDAKLVPFVWDRQVLFDRHLRDFIGSAYKRDTPQVFLFASQFEDYAPHPQSADARAEKDADKIWRRKDGGRGWTELLANESVRLENSVVVKEIFRRKILLVASAGQPETDIEGRGIDWETPMSPQNLGDYENVLIVGACTDCGSETADMWTKSNRSKNGNNFVSLLAPGGDTVPTYVSDRQVGETTGGTSAAAAFTAGLAAKMSACYPSTYHLQAENLKERLILASRPLAGADSSWRARVAGGILDPSVSMLDPTRTWLKLSDARRPVRPVEFRHWCSERLKFRDSSRDSLNLFSTRRLTTVRSQIVAQSVDVDDDELLVRRIVRRELPDEPASPEQPIAAVQYEGRECAVATGEMEDLFLASASDKHGDCGTLPLCGE